VSGVFKKVVIGVDFDNAVAIYDEVMHSSARELGLIDSGVAPNKKEVRDVIRMRPGGELEWQKLQGLVYGPKMLEAQLAHGVMEFFRECRRREIRLHIVSHKTEYANYDDTRTNLREAAMAWMRDNGFFDTDDISLGPEDFFMESTRRAKLKRIQALGCHYFVDDLEEIFLDQEFPAGVQGILYATTSSSRLPSGIKVASTWDEVTNYVGANLGWPMATLANLPENKFQEAC